MEERRKEWPVQEDDIVVQVQGPPRGTHLVVGSVDICDCPVEGQIWEDLLFTWGYCTECGHSAQLLRDEVRKH